MADLLCRWRNATPENVVFLVNSLPHKKMRSKEFRSFMKDHWDGDFFRTPYQVACQLGLYYESEDGYFHPRFDHNISTDEALEYLEFWAPRYYVPNPYTSDGSFDSIPCPTFVLSALANYALKHPGCSFLEAFQKVFKEEESGNDDIVKNIINKYSKVLYYSKDAKLNATGGISIPSVDSVSRNDKEFFFNLFTMVKSISRMERYASSNIKERQQMFYDYMIGNGLAVSSAKQYASIHAVNEEVVGIVKQESGKGSLFEVVDILLVDKIYKLVNQLPVNKKRNNALSASIYNYKHFLDWLEGIDDSTPVEHQEAASETTEALDIRKVIEVIKNSGLQYEDNLIVRFTISLLTKPFMILSGLAGSGKTQLAIAFAKAICENFEQQTCVVPVGADWTNREPLLGYPNALKDKEYETPDTGVLQIILRAFENNNKPYFLILDEMNLSYVERYFADFLSAMESHEPIPLWDKEGDEIPKSVELPKNLFIIGTINVDETTYMFSPKVLDRANVIEFKISEKEMSSFLDKVPNVELSHIAGALSSMAVDFVSIAKSSIESGFEESKALLIKFFSQLKTVNAEFGYRSATEIGRFIALAKEQGHFNENKSVDAAIVQKLLPKLHGSRKKLVPVLTTLWDMCETGIGLELAEGVPEQTKYPLTADKLLRMYRGALDNGFTSFAEA